MGETLLLRICLSFWLDGIGCVHLVLIKGSLSAVLTQTPAQVLVWNRRRVLAYPSLTISQQMDRISARIRSAPLPKRFKGAQRAAGRLVAQTQFSTTPQNE